LPKYIKADFWLAWMLCGWYSLSMSMINCVLGDDAFLTYCTFCNPLKIAVKQLLAAFRKAAVITYVATLLPPEGIVALRAFINQNISCRFNLFPQRFLYGPGDGIGTGKDVDILVILAPSDSGKAADILELFDQHLWPDPRSKGSGNHPAGSLRLGGTAAGFAEVRKQFT